MVKSHVSVKIAHACSCAVIARTSKDMEKENVSHSKDNHPVKKRRLSLSLKGKHRFQAASDNDLAKLSKPQVPQNTDVSTRWAMKNFTDWYQDYNARNPKEPCSEEVISPKCSATLLNTWLSVDYNVHSIYLPNYSSEQCDENNYDC